MTKQKSVTVVRLSAMAAAVAMACSQAQAFEFDTGDSDLKVRWDNTLKYSTMYRIKDPDATQVSKQVGTPAGDGNFNFKKGVVSNRLDLLTEFDAVKDNKYGVRVSGVAWYDDVYQHGNDNTTGFTHNRSTSATQFTSGTRDAVGDGSRLMDAFVFGKGELGTMPVSARLGRHAVIYGETLMDGSNGIAAAQGAVDITKAATVPGAQVKEFILPTNQISATLQPTNQISLGGYYQFKWEKSPFFGAGSFLSPNDFATDGSEAFASSPVGGQVPRRSDMTPSKSGQWGTQMRFRPDSVDVELGLYAANYHDKTPSAGYLDPVSGTYRLAYQENIKVYGASASTVLGSDNVSIEASMRDNMPLTGGVHPGLAYGYVIANPNYVFDNKDHQGYAVGKTAHMTLVDIHVIQPNFLMRDGGSLAVQYDWHQVQSVTKNPAAVDPTTTKDASKITVAFTADYFQVMDGLDLSFPLVVSHSVHGASRVYAGWVKNGGSVDVGVNFKYRNAWKAGLNYHHFYGTHGTGVGDGHFDQTMWDRDYVAFNLSTSF
jgi:hypothetical protein